MHVESAMARFLERRGARVFEAAGTLWGHYRGPFYVSLPYHSAIDPEPAEVRELMWKHRIPSLRFPSAKGAGLAGGFYVASPADYSLDRLPRRTRAEIRHGLDACDIRPVDPGELLSEGLALNLDTMRRQRRFDAEFGAPERWKQFVAAVRDTPEVYAYGAYVDGRLAAYVVGCREGDWLHLLYKMTRNEYRGLSLSYALDHWLMMRTAADPSIRTVANSFLSVLPNPGLDRYKRHTGFSEAPCRMAVYFHPAFAGLATSRAVVSGARRAWQAWPQSSRLELAAKLFEGARTTMTNPIAVSAQATFDPCQHTGCFQYSRLSRPFIIYLLRTGIRRIRAEGLMPTLRMALNIIRYRRLSPPVAKPMARTPIELEALNLQPGDRVRVKSADAIRATLDPQGKHRGMSFVPVEMLTHCGQEYQVHKRVGTIFLEESRQNRKLKNTVLLSGVQCQGIGLDCDRSCYLFWREAWLEKVEN